jgi:hypothetical protein
VSDISELGKRVMQIQPKNHSVDNTAFKSMHAFVAALLFHHLLKGAGAVTVPFPWALRD